MDAGLLVDTEGVAGGAMASYDGLYLVGSGLVYTAHTEAEGAYHFAALRQLPVFHSSVSLSEGRFFAVYSVDDPLKARADDRAGHCEIQADIARRVANEQLVAALKQHARFICKEARQIHALGQAFAEIDPRKIGRLGDIHDRLGQLAVKEFLGKGKIAVKIGFKRLVPLPAPLVGCRCGGERERINVARELVAASEALAKSFVTDNYI